LVVSINGQAQGKPKTKNQKPKTIFIQITLS